MESDKDSDVENMITQRHKSHRQEKLEVFCSDTKHNVNWSPKAWIWRISNAIMVVFFVTAAYVQVRIAHCLCLISATQRMQCVWPMRRLRHLLNKKAQLTQRERATAVHV